MNASSSKTLVIALGGLGLLAVVAAASRAKAAKAAADQDPEVTPPGPPIPLPASLPQQPSSPEVTLPPPNLQPPAAQPAVNPPPVLDAPVLPSMPTSPVSTVPTTPPDFFREMEPTTSTPAAPAASMPTYPVTVPAATAAKGPVKRPFGDEPLDVQATKSNVAPPAAATKPAPAAPAKRTAQQAAAELLAYVTPILKAGRGSELGVKNSPNSFVKAAQLDMNDIPADGIYGPRTREKGKQLIGKTFPVRK